MQGLSAIQYVTSGLSLIAFVAALAFNAYRLKVKSAADLLGKVPTKDRLAALSSQAEMLHIDIQRGQLSAAALERIVMEQLKVKERRNTIHAAVALLIAVLLSSVAVITIVATRQSKAGATTDTQIGVSNSGTLSVGGDVSISQHTESQQNAKTSQIGLVNPGSLVVQGNLTIGNSIGQQAIADCTKGYLQVRLDDRIGTLVMDSPASNENHPRRFRFYVGNPTTNCTAVVSAVFVEVVDSVDDHHPSLEALTAVYKYRANISRKDIGHLVQVTDKSFNYTPQSSPDQFVIDVFSKELGVAYALRFGVAWMDLKTGAKGVSKSWVALAPYPDGQGELFGGSDASVWRKQQLIGWRRSLDRSDSAIADASIEDPPFERE